MVVLCRHVHKGFGDRRQIHPASANSHPALIKIIVPHQLFRGLAEILTRQREHVHGPAIEHPVAFDEFVIPHIVPQPDVPRNLRTGAKHRKGGVEHFGRAVAECLHNLIDIEKALVRPCLKRFHRLEIHRRRERHQIFEAGITVQCGPQQRQHATKTIADHAQIGLAAFGLYPRDAGGNKIEDIILHRQRLLPRAGRFPIDHENVVPAPQQELDEALSRHHVEDVTAVRCRHDKQDRHAVNIIHDRAIVIQPQSAARDQDILGARTQNRIGRGEIAKPLYVALHRAIEFGARDVERVGDLGHASGVRVRLGFGAALVAVDLVIAASIRAKDASIVAMRTPNASTSALLGMFAADSSFAMASCAPCCAFSATPVT